MSQRDIRAARYGGKELARAAMVVLAFLLQGCATTTATTHRDAVLIAQLTRQAEEWDRAIVRKDTPAIAGNMCADFRQIRVSGDVVDGTTFMRDITSADLVIDPYTVEDFEVRLYGDVALLSGRTRMTGRYAGAVFTSHYRYIDVYVRADGAWKVCSVQITRMPN